jgi:LysM repeat protein
MTANVDFDNPFEEGEPEAEETADEAPKKRSPLRLVLLVLVILVLLCVVCFAGSRLLGGVAGNAIGGLLPEPLKNIVGVAQQAPVVPPAADTTLPPATDQSPLPGAGTPPATQETPTTGEVPPTQQPLPPAEQPLPSTQQPGEATPITAPVPGPTNTPIPGGPTPQVGPTVIITTTPITGCETNQLPIAKANGPYTGMMGKGLGLVNFDAAGSNDPDGTITKYEWDFGDSSQPAVGAQVTYGYTNIGNYVAILTVTDNCNATGQDTAEVVIVGPTPPTPDGNGNTPTPTVAVTATPVLSQNQTTGFCYLVQYGDTLSGIAWYYGLWLQDLAAVNGVSTEYYVIAGQGLFIPIGPVTTGPNVYQAQADDTLYSIAYQCGLTPAAIATANNLDINTALKPGQSLIIPLGR